MGTSRAGIVSDLSDADNKVRASPVGASSSAMAPRKVVATSSLKA